MRVFRMAPPGRLLAAVLFFAATGYGVARPSHRFKNLPYVPATAPDFSPERHRLDVYAPEKAAGAAGGYPVVLFIHGGNWDSGNKNIYTFIGRRLARQGVVAVLINYRLAPAVRVPGQAADCARALAWTVGHIGQYGGDSSRVFVMGHSAGGGLAALLATDDSLLARHGLPHHPVRGAILDDAAGLDMYSYLKEMRYEGDQRYLVPFGPDPAGWKAVSPLYKIRPGLPPFLVFIGGETFPGIARSSARFRDQLRATGQPPAWFVLPGKKHVAMVLQLYWKDNIIYQELLKMVR